MYTNKSKVSVSVCMFSNSRTLLVLLSCVIIMHRSILNKKTYLKHKVIGQIHIETSGVLSVEKVSVRKEGYKVD